MALLDHDAPAIDGLSGNDDPATAAFGDFDS
jgi:hypothetical protein